MLTNASEVKDPAFSDAVPSDSVDSRNNVISLVVTLSRDSAVNEPAVNDDIISVMVVATTDAELSVDKPVKVPERTENVPSVNVATRAVTSRDDVDDSMAKLVKDAATSDEEPSVTVVNCALNALRRERPVSAAA